METGIKRATLKEPWKGYTDIWVDMDSCDAPGSYTYDCEIISSGAHIRCHRDEFEFDD